MAAVAQRCWAAGNSLSPPPRVATVRLVIGAGSPTARGRGPARLIEAAWAGEPWAIGILAVVGLVLIGSIVMKMRSGDE
jgi:hypothetical protein